MWLVATGPGSGSRLPCRSASRTLRPSIRLTDTRADQRSKWVVLLLSEVTVARTNRCETCVEHCRCLLDASLSRAGVRSRRRALGLRRMPPPGPTASPGTSRLQHTAAFSPFARCLLVPYRELMMLLCEVPFVRLGCLAAGSETKAKTFDPESSLVAQKLGRPPVSRL